MRKIILFAIMLLLQGPCMDMAHGASTPAMVGLQMMTDTTGHSTTNILPAGRFFTHHSLSANTAKTITVPAGARWMMFAPQANIWVNYSGGTAVVPTTDVTDGSGSLFSPPMMYIGDVYSGGVVVVPAISTISVISDTTWTVTAMWYR